MSNESVIEIGVEDGPFKEFLQIFRQYRDAVASLPAEFRTSAKAASDVTDEIERTAGATKALDRALAAQASARTETSRAAATSRVEAIRQSLEMIEHERALVTLERERASLEREAARDRREEGKERDKIAGERRKVELDHQRANETALKDQQQVAKDMLGHAQSVAKIFGGMAGGVFAAGSITGALAAVFSAAAHIGGERTAAQSLNATAGQVKAFETNFGRLGLDPSFMGTVRDMANDPSRASMFGPMGISDEEVAAARRSGDYSQLTVDAIKAVKRFSEEAGPDGLSPQMINAKGFGERGLGLDQSHVAVIAAQTNADLDRFSRQFQTDSKSMNIADPTQKAWQDVNSSLQRLSNDVEKIFFGGSGVNYLARAVDDLDQIVQWKGIFDLPHELTLPGMLHKAFPWIPDWGAKPGTGAPTEAGTSAVPGVAPGSAPLPRGLFVHPTVPPDGAPGSTHGVVIPDALPDGTARLTPAQYQTYFAKLEKAAGLPAGLLGGLAKNESGYNPHPADTADGPGGENHQGMFQMSTSMLRKYGVSNPFDVNEVAPAAAAEEADYLRHFHGNVAEAIAAWNRGQPGVDADIRAGGGTDDGFLTASSPKVQSYMERAIQEMLRIQQRPQQIKVIVENRSGANVHVSANALSPA